MFLHNFDPVIFSLGSIKITWYGLSYFVSILAGWQYALKLAEKYAPHLKRACDDYVTWAIISLVLGGRLGHVLFYDLAYYLENPIRIIMTWKGGMSFHGGLLGAIIAGVIFCLKRKISMYEFADIALPAVPIGLFFGRIANFINGELFGTPTTLPWGVVFPHGGDVPRHPTQLYEAFFEGFVLFILLYGAWKKGLYKRPGLVSGIFLIFYGASRFIIEFLKQPDEHIGYFLNIFTLGQLLCLPMILGSLWLFKKAYNAK